MKFLNFVLPIGLALASSFFSLDAVAQTNVVRKTDESVNSPEVRMRQGLHPNENLLFNGWGVTPAGEQVVTTDLPLKLVVTPDGKRLVAVHGGFNQHGLSVFDVATHKLVQFLPLERSWNGIAFSRDGKQCFVTGGSSDKIYLFNYAGGKFTLDHEISLHRDGPVFLSGIVVHPETGKLYVCSERDSEIWVLDPKTWVIEKTIAVGEHPYTCMMGADHRNLYVSDWGSRSVSVLDTKTGRKTKEISVGLRPNEMALAKDGRLFVACSGDNTVHVIQTQQVEEDEVEADPNRRISEAAREIISTSLYVNSPEGSTPDAVAVSPDGKTLFVANADNNCVAVVDISNSLSENARRFRESVSVVEGFIPVGWYPSAIAVSPDNQTLFVGNGKGLASRPNSPELIPNPEHRFNAPNFDYIGTTLTGAISFIHRPDAKQMTAYTEQVRRNSPYTPEQFRSAPIASDSAIPAKVGGDCPIKYVLYIIKENRTYDQVLGDFKDAQGKLAGNGDPNLAMYGENISPNHHQLARTFVLLDNLYCNSEVSQDGHSWCDAAIATDYKQRSWILSYSKHGHLLGNNEMDVPSAGYLWDLCKRHGVSFMNYGEGAGRVPSANRGTWSGGRDMDRVKGWIGDLQKAEKTGILPYFMIMSLGEDHTRATKPGAFTPDASVASNDLGLARIVEAASHSPFWKEMAIFVIEDDAQNGPDHVDAHRTVGFVISPYCKRGFIDSTLYTTASMVRTMELILGLPPLTQYDAAATPMFNSFTKVANLTPYEPLPPRVDVLAKNTEKSPGAKKSARMDFHDYDLAPEDEMNRILWADAKGPNVPYPTPIHRVIFTQGTAKVE